MADQPIIIKRIKKGVHGHHGGAWKVAYADFVTAMMAFFLLLWLLNAVTQEQLEGISNYFTPVSIARTTSGAGGLLGGQTVGSPGALQGSGTPVVTMDLPQPRAGGGPQQSESEQEAQNVAEAAAEAERKREQEQFEQAEQAIRQAIAQIPSLRDLAKGLMIDKTPEGLRIQIVDQEGLAMFPSGSAEMHQHTRRAIELVAQVIKQMSQDLSISGHTDAVPFSTSHRGYTNWELSADRENATRRALMDFGVPQERLARVVGAAANDPLIADDPKNPRNRRIAIVLLREQPMAETPAKTN